MGLEDLFTPRSVTEQLDPALNAVKRTMGEYRKNITRVTNEMVVKGYVVKPYLEGDHEQRSRDLLRMLNDFDPHDMRTFIIPHDAEIFPNVRRSKLSKKHNLTVVRRFRPSTEEKKPSSEVVVDALKRIKVGDVRVGIDYKGVHSSNLAYRVFTLFDCIRAYLANLSLTDSETEVTLYIDTEKVLERGGSAEVIVPSFSGGKKHRVVLNHMAIHHPGTIDERVIRTSYDLTSSDTYLDSGETCERKDFFTIKYGRSIVRVFGRDERTGDEILLDHHTILAFKRAVRAIQRRGYEVIDPFPPPNKTTLELHWKLMDHVLVETRDGRYLRRSPIGESKVLMETLLQKHVGLRNEL